MFVPIDIFNFTHLVFVALTRSNDRRTCEDILLSFLVHHQEL